MHRTRNYAEAGFSLLELVMSLAILLIIAGAAFQGLGQYQKSYTSTLMQSDMHAGMRSTVELVAQEIGQSGLLASASTTTAAAIMGSSAAQVVTVGSTAGMFVGEKLLIDTGTAQEVVAITALTASPASITGVFTQNHAASVLVNAVGVFPQGILGSSTATSLRLFGDINADGTLVYVRYDCNPTTGTLSRSITPATSGTLNASVVLLTNLVPTTGVTGCFNIPAATTVAGYSFIPSVGLTLSSQTSQLNPQTGQYVVMTKSFLNLSPRNVLAGLDLANTGITNRLQPTPAAVTVLDAQ